MRLKRFAAAALAFCLVLTLLPGDVSAAATSGDGWSLSADGVLTVTADVWSDSDPSWGGQASSIKRVTVGRNVKTVSGKAFSACGNLEAFTVEQGNTAFSAGADGVLYSADGQELVCYPAAHSDTYAGHPNLYMVPRTVVKVALNAFSGLTANNKKLTFYAYEDTRATVTKNVKAFGGDDFPAGMIQTYVPVTGVTLDTGTLPLEIGDTETLTATVLPAEATFKDVTWESQATEFATVDKGKVTGVSTGTANIVVTTEDGKYTATCVVTVVKKDVKGLELIPDQLTVDKGTTKSLKARVSPYFATYRNISFFSTDTNVVKISDEGCVRKDPSGAVTFEAEIDTEETTASVSVDVIGVNPGTASIIATTADSGYYAVCKVTVPATEITKFELDSYTLELTRTEDKEDIGTLTATVEPSNATYGVVSWYSSDKNVVKVSENANPATLTTVGPGKAAVVARTADGRQLSCAVTVWDAPTGVGMSMTDLTLAPNETWDHLYAVVLPETADQRVTWVSSDEKKEVIKFNEETGAVTAVGNGTATIKAISVADGNCVGMCTVTVKTSVTGITLNKTTLELEEDGAETLTATVQPGTASNKSVTWYSLNEDVATVDDKGLVTAKKPGTAKILAVTNDGGEKAECTVTVKATKVTGVTLDKSEITLGLNVNNAATLKAAVAPSTAKNYSVTWSSSKPEVVNVTNGVLTSYGIEDTALITVTVTTAEGDFTAQCSVTVQRNAVTRVTLDRNELELDLLENPTDTLTATVAPANATDQNVTWKSSDTGIATVGERTGFVTAKAPGSAVITATTSDGEFTATCTVTVLPIRVTSVTLDKGTHNLKERETFTLTATVSPSNATNKDVEWVITDTNVIGRDANGDFYAKAPGTATIIVATKDGGCTAQCTVTVYQPVKTVSIHKTAVILNVGETDTLAATVLPVTAPQSVTWSSSADDVAEVDENTGVVTAKKGGKAIITAEAADGQSATCEVTVREPVTSVGLNYTSYVLELGGAQQKKTVDLIPEIQPGDATIRDVQWYSSNDNVAEVDAAGRVTAKEAGTAAIVVVTEDGGKTASCNVTVHNNVTGVTLDRNTLSLETGESRGLIATVEPSVTEDPALAADQSVIWTSSRENIATVKNGVVTALAVGETIITATSVADNEEKAACTVTVTDATVSVKRVTLNKTELTLAAAGDTETLTATVEPGDASNQNVSWMSTDPSVATVGETSGLVTAVTPGKATIIVTTVDGRHTAMCVVTVPVPEVKVTGVALNRTSMTIGLGQDAETLVAMVEPYNAKNQAVDFAISSEGGSDVITLSTGDGNSRTISPKGVGTATVKVSSREDPSIFKECTVTVLPKAVESVEINAQYLTLYVNEPGNPSLSVTISRNDGTAPTDPVTRWISQNDAVAEVDNNGVVTGKSEGTTLITAEVTDQARQVYTASCAVRVISRPVESITLDKTGLTLAKGATAETALHATVHPNNADQSVIWRSTNDTVATVDQDGFVTGVGAGTAQIVATTKDGTHSTSCTVTVTSTEVTGLSLNKTALSLVFTESKPGSETLTATIASGGESPDVTWTSDNGAVATVGETTGVVTAVGKGTATITASVTQDGKPFTATCEVTVRAAVTGITLNPKSVTLERDGTTTEPETTLTETVAPSYASDASVKWHSSNPAVATVDDSGKVTAVHPGTTAIVAATVDGGFTASCVVTVRNKPTGISLNKSALTMTKNEKETLVATVSPDGAMALVTWSSSDSTVAAVDQNGVVTAKESGSAVITAATSDESGTTYTVTCNVKVNDPTTPVTGVTLPATLTLKAAEGSDPAETATLTATVEPEGATNKTVSWMSTDPSVATVDGTGKVTAVAPGKTTIIVTTEDGRFTAMCAVTVPAPEVEIELDKTELTMYMGDNNVALKAEVKPFTAAYSSLNWFTSDDAIADVTDNGVVSAVSSGTAVITAATPDGMYTARCVVTVWKKTEGLTLNKTPLLLAPDESWGLSAKVNPTGANPAVIWEIQSASDPDCVEVTPDGLVTAHSAGEAVIVATTKGHVADGKTGTAVCNVRIVEHKISSEIEAPTITISDGSAGKTVALSAAAGDQIWYYLGEAAEPVQYKDEVGPIEVDANTTIRAYAIRGKYQSVVVTGVINVTGPQDNMIVTDKMGNIIESLTDITEDSLFMANITLSEEAAKDATDIYIAFYDQDGKFMALEKFGLESDQPEGTAETDSQVISQGLRLNIPADVTIGSIKLMVLSAGKAPVMGARALGS